MALRDFQRAMCDLVADPQLCLRLRREPDAVLGRYELSERERRRLRGVVAQPGMSVNCTLYRANRITPLYSRLPHSCTLLGARFGEEVSAFWRATDAELHFGPEVGRFAEFLRGRVRRGELESPYLLDVLDFEQAFNVLRLAPRRRLLAELEHGGSGDAWALNPLVRVVRFDHDPVVLLEALAAGRVPAGLARGEHYLVIDASEAVPELRTISARFGALLEGAAPGLPLQVEDAAERRVLVEANLLVAL